MSGSTCFATKARTQARSAAVRPGDDRSVNVGLARSGTGTFTSIQTVPLRPAASARAVHRLISPSVSLAGSRRSRSTLDASWIGGGNARASPATSAIRSAPASGHLVTGRFRIRRRDLSADAP